jgi:lipopolysaccharide/colanic/teichoic acid biosynthesis glycosyltransferase
VLSRVAVWDVACGGASPLVAFLLRDGTIKSPDSVAIYCGIAFLASLLVFQWLQTSSPISRYFSIRDALDLLKACILIAALSAVLAFLFTRLEAAPRSIPVLQLILLASALLAQRLFSRLHETRRETRVQEVTNSVQHVLVIQASRLAWFFSKMIEELAPGEYQIVAILDERSKLQHRSLNGYPIVGSPAHIEKIVDAYALHGIKIDKVIVATKPDDISKGAWHDVLRVCQHRQIELEVLADRLISGLTVVADNAPAVPCATEAAAIPLGSSEGLLARPFWKFKRIIDFAVAFIVAVLTLPITVVVCGLALLDVGVPVIFWQQRVGRDGAALYLYKFRTLQTLFDRRTKERRETRKPSAIGLFLRKTRLDELPQLWNILSGDMSFIGPRPLLPVDQPTETSIRLTVRPGLTGWAQICGGKLISPEEKNALDEWYIRHASLWLDAIIVLRTLWMLLTGDRRDEKAISVALVEKYQGELDNVSDSINSEIKEQRSALIKRAEAMRLADAGGFSSGRDHVPARSGDAPARSAFSKKKSA